MSDESSYVYDALKVKHKDNNDSPELYILTANARELAAEDDGWAEVPRANVDFMDGYQRQLEPSRTDDIKNFLETPENIIPGAILVTVDEEYLSISEEDGHKKVEIEMPEEKDLEELLQEAYQKLYERLDNSGKKYVDSINNGEDDESEDEEMPVSYLAKKTGELREKMEDLDSITEEEEETLREFAKRNRKPGLIIDGQHRVYGAKKSPDPINYPIVLIPGLEDKEQVYHFYMINDKAEPISPGELLITVTTALSRKESDDLLDRLTEANVPVNKAKYPYMADVEKKSPFYNLVNYEEKVDEKTGIVRFRHLADLMERFAQMKGIDDVLVEDIDEWYGDDETRYRVDKFYTFWEAIQEHYESLWIDAKLDVQDEKEFDGDKAPDQFFQKAVMRVLQRYILDHLAQKQESWKNVRQDVLEEINNGDEARKLEENIIENDERMKEEIKEIIGEIPGKFFRYKWETSGLNTNENRENFYKELNKASNTEAKDILRLQIFNQGF